MLWHLLLYVEFNIIYICLTFRVMELVVMPTNKIVTIESNKVLAEIKRPPKTITIESIIKIMIPTFMPVL